MSDHRPFPAVDFDQAGLNRQHVFALDALPAEVRATLGDTANYTQLILLGHGGKHLWAQVKAASIPGEHPIDDYTIKIVEQVFAMHFADKKYRILYPGETAVGLQQLGTLAGWHQPSPFMVGIDREWGSWFAYRAAVLADTDFSPFLPVDRSNPCTTCASRPCLTHCPADALMDGFSLHKCSNYRKQPNSLCRHTCLARLSCPVGIEHRYDEDQMHHTYALSLKAIEQYD